MYFCWKADVIYRNYGSFGYITDNRNFGYKSVDYDVENDKGDKIVSKSSLYFLDALERQPQSIDRLANKIWRQFPDENFMTIKQDASDFYIMLAEELFIAMGSTYKECNKNKIENNVSEKKDHQAMNPITTRGLMMDTHEFFERHFHGNPQLTNVLMEITNGCNEHCVHCYLSHKTKPHFMNSELFRSILIQSRKMNVLHVTLTGGEPLLHADILSFLDLIYEFNFSVNILSNLTLLNQSMIGKMKRNQLLCVQTSLYSMDAAVHDAITQVKGSFKKTTDSVLKLCEQGVPVQISCPILKQNRQSYRDVIEWGNSLKIRVNSDLSIFGKCDCSMDNLKNRLSIHECVELLKESAQKDPLYYSELEKEYLEKKELDLNDRICSVLRFSLCIGADGSVYPCAGWRGGIIGNIKTDNLAWIWENSEKAHFYRNLKRRDFIQCSHCEQAEFCTICMMRNANENYEGNPFKVSKYFCEIAKIKRNLYQSYFMDLNRNQEVPV